MEKYSVIVGNKNFEPDELMVITFEVKKIIIVDQLYSRGEDKKNCQIITSFEIWPN